MIALPETLRQLFAGLAAAGAFLALFFGMGLVAWAAGIGALLVFVAALLIIERRKPAAERMLVDGVSEADLAAALQAFQASADRLRVLEAAAPSAERGVFESMATVLERIRAHHQQDPRDLKHTRRFLRHDLPRLVESAEGYVELAGRSGPGEAARLQTLGERIRGYGPALEKIERACLDNDFMRLDVETDVLSGQLAQR